ncbi:MAG: DUF1015 domain-containing protein [Acidimicrobiales bacterium]|jgi:uncharacterized protein (DUF1015 family)
MARLDPFPAIRYDTARVDPDAVVAPPYDVVGPAERAVLAKRSPYNAIHVDLPVPDESRGLDPYENAARTFAGWLENGIVVRDPVPAFYAYRMTFHDERGRRREMTGVLGALGLDLEGSGEILPHEQTMPKDRADRLSLLHSMRLNTSPIWGLSLAKGLTVACRAAISQAGRPDWRATDDALVAHELWVVTDESTIAEISGLGASAQVLIADGHHRYQTACTYAAESRARNADLPGPHDFVLAFVVELSEDELSIRSFHRLVTGVPADRVIEVVGRWFRIEPAPEDLIALPANSAPSVIGLLTRDGYRLLYPLPALEEAAEDDLDSSRLMVMLDDLPEHELSYEPEWHEAAVAVRSERAEAAFLLRPVPVAKIEAVAETGRLMPPKTTYFHPKPRTGMAFRSLD